MELIYMVCYFTFQSLNSIPTAQCCSTKYLLPLPLRFFGGVEFQFPCIKSRFHCSIGMEFRIYSYPLHRWSLENNINWQGELKSQNSKQMMMAMRSWIIYGTALLIIRWSSIMRTDVYFSK